MLLAQKPAILVTVTFGEKQSVKNCSFFACHKFKTLHTYSMANLNTLFDKMKDTESIDPKLKDLLQGLIENINSKVDIIVGLQNRVHFLENKINEMERYSSKDCAILQNLPLRSGNFTQDVLAFLMMLWAWR